MRDDEWGDNESEWGIGGNEPAWGDDAWPEDVDEIDADDDEGAIDDVDDEWGDTGDEWDDLDDFGGDLMGLEVAWAEAVEWREQGLLWQWEADAESMLDEYDEALHSLGYALADNPDPDLALRVALDEMGIDGGFDEESLMFAVLDLDVDDLRDLRIKLDRITHPEWYDDEGGYHIRSMEGDVIGVLDDDRGFVFFDDVDDEQGPSWEDVDEAFESPGMWEELDAMFPTSEGEYVGNMEDVLPPGYVAWMRDVDDDSSTFDEYRESLGLDWSEHDERWHAVAEGLQEHRDSRWDGIDWDAAEMALVDEEIDDAVAEGRQDEVDGWGEQVEPEERLWDGNVDDDVIWWAQLGYTVEEMFGRSFHDEGELIAYVDGLHPDDSQQLFIELERRFGQYGEDDTND